MKKTSIFVVAAVSLLLLFVLAMIAYQGVRSDRQALANRDTLERAHAPTLGPAGAPVVITEFFDPACGTCRQFYPLVKEMLAAHPRQIRLVLRYAPFHPGSDQVVALLEAARAQGKLWPALEAVLASQDSWSPNHRPQLALVWRHLEGIGLDLERARAEMTDPRITRLIAQDVADAQALNVTKTPEFFVNGRPLPSFGYEPLKNLVDEALRQATR